MKTNKATKKDCKKAVRSVLQGIFLLFLLYLIITALFTIKRYVPYQKTDVAAAETSPGFVAVSYFGVDRDGTDSLISVELLEKHLEALHTSGYVTITQQDILDYYENGKPLPERALFLMFEDGRRDTAIFAQKPMENYNYRATIMTYADKFFKKDSKFLMPNDILELEKNSFWEAGSNGSRLSYINVFDRHGNYLGEMDSNQFIQVSSYLDRNYDHYLMDYLRDANGLPKEGKDEMTARILADYEQMRQTYTEEIGGVPKAYVLMHSNTGRFGTNENASRVNEEGIAQTFQMNFNRESRPLNSGGSVYNLTRMQPQSYWSTNHLLMRLWDDTRQPMQFVTGEALRAEKWELKSGAAEFIDNAITLTTLPDDAGRLWLKDYDAPDLHLSVTLDGNKFGGQSLLLRADAARTGYLQVEIKNNHLIVSQYAAGKLQVLSDLDLDVHDGIVHQSMAENKKEAEVAELEIRRTSLLHSEQEEGITDAVKEREQLPAPSVSNGAEPYVPPIELSERGSRKLEITLVGDTLTASVDGKTAVEGLCVNSSGFGGLCLETEWGGASYSQRNLTDNVYDGVFNDLLVSTPEGLPLFDSRLHGWEAVVHGFNKVVSNVVNWFIKTL